MLQALVALTTKNHDLFMTEFVGRLISLITENKKKLDASILHALLQLQHVFHAFQRTDERVLHHLMHSTTIFNSTKAMH